MPVDVKGKDLPPSSAERGDALLSIKKMARDNFMRLDGTEEEFEDLWRTAFGVEEVEPNSED